MHISFKSLILIILFALTSGTRPIRSEDVLSVPVSSSPATISKPLSPIARAAVSAYWVASELVHQHLVPAIRDQLWQPTCQFLREQEEAAIQRRLKARQQEQPVTPLPVESSPQPQELIRRPLPVQAPIHPPTLVVATTPRTLVTKVRNLSSKKSWSVAWLPMRFVKLSLMAWILAEVLDRVGILHEETPAILRSQVHRVWYDLQPHWFQLRDWIVTTWHRIAPKGLVPTRLHTKYQFAMGATMGMMTASPLLSLAWKPAVLIYTLAELNARAKMEGRWNLEHVFHPTLAHQIDEGLEKLRHSIANLLAPITSPQLLLGPTGGGITKVATYSLGLAPAKMKTQADQKGQEDWEQERFWEMVRHGVVVGVLLGLVGKL